MSVEELERFVLSVMKKELNTIVNLGALIGFVLELLNNTLMGICRYIGGDTTAPVIA